MENVKISCEICTSDASVPLGLEIWIDENKIFDENWIKETVKFEHNLDLIDGDHQLCFVMKNKTSSHTTIDQHGNIVKDAVLSIKKIFFDEIDLDYLISKTAIYEHDFNGTGNPTQDKFYQHMGCNGIVTVKFSTPYYIWLLENM